MTHRISLLLSMVVVALACDRKGFRDEIVFTGAAPNSPGRGVMSPGDSEPLESMATSSPVPRTVNGIDNGVSGDAADDDVGDDDATASDDDVSSGNEPSPDDVGDSDVVDDAEPSPTMADPGTEEPDVGAEPDGTVQPEPDGATDPTPVEPEPVPFTKERLLEASAQCALANYERFDAAAVQLTQAAEAYESGLLDAEKLALQQAWLTAALAWQRAELFSFGPAARSTEPGGMDLRDQIYSWPSVSRCRVEEQLVNEAYVSPDFSTSLVNGRTLAAIEFLSFHTGTENACSQFSVINAEGSWQALSASELVRRRAAYARRAAADVRERSARLLDAWAPNGGNFSRELTLAGSSSSTFATQQAALNAISNALFYLDKEVKDSKLATPLGLMPECPTTACPEALESRYALVSTLFLYENLIGFEQLFAGCEAGASIGFDDWLVEVGASDLAGRMQSALDDVQALVADLNSPIEDALLSDRAKVESLHAGVKRITDLLKAEFVTVLNLELPASAETDND